MIDILLWTLVISLVINCVFFAIAYPLQSDKFTDITYSLSFILIAIYVYYNSEQGTYEAIGTLLILMWALRLGGFLLYRVIRNGKDGRFDGTREKFSKFALFWFNQALVAWVLMIPASLAFTDNQSFTVFSLVGVVVMLLGLLIESFADYQKFSFRLNPSNKDKWIDSGVWRYARHPNYFGEMLVWAGVYLYALPALDGVAKILGLVSPLVIVLLLRYGSGVPILEKSADKKWGKNPKYIAYKKKTNLLIPFFKSR